MLKKIKKKKKILVQSMKNLEGKFMGIPGRGDRVCQGLGRRNSVGCAGDGACGVNGGTEKTHTHTHRTVEAINTAEELLGKGRLL